MMPVHDPLPSVGTISVDEALKSAVGWSNSNNISKKFSVGTLTTAPYSEKVRVFQEMNSLAEEKSAVLPMSNFQSKHKTDPDKDRFDRRVVKQLQDISFESDSDDESLRNLKRLPNTVLNVENLRKILSPDTTRLNLENHYWLPNDFLAKIGRMAPNLQEFSLRRMKNIDNLTFAEIFKNQKGKLQKIDFCDCDGLHESALKLCLDKNPLLQEIQLSGCKNAVTDEIMEQIATKFPHLYMLDVSFAERLTDRGLKVFEGRKLGLEYLSINGVGGISCEGLGWLVESVSETVRELECAMLMQPTVKGSFGASLGRCY
jgi:hypothetical protein